VTIGYRNPNVRAVLISGLFTSFAFNIIWFSTTWLVYGLGGDNQDLGMLLGVGSLVGVVFAIVGSVLADSYRKDVVVFVFMTIGGLGIYMLSISTTLTEAFIGQILSSIGMSSTYPIIGALLADSVTSMDRTKIYGTQFLIHETGSAFGGITAFIIYRNLVVADIELLDVDVIRFALSVAVGMFFVGYLIAISQLRDKHALSAEEEASVASLHKYEQNILLGKTQNFKNQFSPFAMRIILLSLISAVFIGLGAGTTIPFLPRLFFDIYLIDLSRLSLLMTFVQIFTAIWGKINANLTKKFGRVQIIVFNQMISVVLLYILATYPPLIFSLFALIIRNAVMNGVGPVANSIMMDFSPRSLRAKISTVNGIIWQIFFAIGNIFGGFLVEATSFRVPIIITATLYFIATMIYWGIKQFIDRSEMLILEQIS
jgi:MFS family permease